MTRILLLVTMLVGATPAFAQDAIDLHQAVIENSPRDVADWSITTTITRLEMSPASGLALTFSAQGRDDWRYHVPGWGNGKDDDGMVQYTVWAVAQVRGQWVTSGFIQMWKARPSTGAPILTDFAKNWAYDGRWGALAGYQPHVGELFGVFVTAGNARGEKGVTSLRERSNVVVVALPANDSGVFTFTPATSAVPAPPEPVPTPAPAPAPEVVLPAPAPAPAPIDTTQLNRIEQKVDALDAKVTEFRSAVGDAWKTVLKYVAQYGAPVIAGILGGRAMR